MISLSVYLMSAIALPLLVLVCKLWFTLRYMFTLRHNAMKLQKKFGKPVEGRHWLLGHTHLLRFTHDSLLLSNDRTAKHWPYNGLWIGPFYMGVETACPEVVQAFVKNSRDKKDELAYHYIRPWIGEGLLVAHGDKWARNRKLLTPAFHFDIIKQYVVTMNQSTQLLLNNWERRLVDNAATFDVSVDTCKLSLDILLKCIFGSEQDILNDEELDHPYLADVKVMCDVIIERFKRVELMNDFIFSILPIGRKFKKACDRVHAFSKLTVQTKRNQLHNLDAVNGSSSKRLSFLDIIMTARDELGEGLTDQEIQDECDTFMFEGHDTTAGGMSWILHHLAAHPDMQERCRQEVLGVMSSGDVLEYADLDKLAYTTMFIKESMRLTPPVPSAARLLHSDTTLHTGLVIPAGTMVSVSPFVLHRNPHNWDKPEEFDPERFTPEASAKRHPYAYLPFSGGPRNCIGKTFAMSELKVVISLILSKFKLSIDETKPAARCKPHLIMRSENGLWIRTERL